jgi:hypothetical protein
MIQIFKDDEGAFRLADLQAEYKLEISVLIPTWETAHPSAASQARYRVPSDPVNNEESPRDSQMRDVLVSQPRRYGYSAAPFGEMEGWLRGS